jgi:hypothetical protein
MRYVGWYDVYYQCDPAAENVFGRETLRQRRNPALSAWLRSGGLCRISFGCRRSRTKLVPPRNDSSVAGLCCA